MDETAIYMHRHAKNSDFSIDFAIFTIWLLTYVWTDRLIEQWTDRQNNGRTDQ